MSGHSLSGLAARQLTTRALHSRLAALPHLLAPRPRQHAHRRPPVAASLDDHHGTAPGITWGTLPFEVEQEQFGWSSAVAQDSTCTVEQATELAVMEALSQWPAGQAQPHLAIVFVSSSYHRVYDRVMPLLLQKLPSLQHVVGCSGEGVMGMRQGAPEEWEARPAVSVTLAALPGVTLRSCHVPQDALPDADAAPQSWHELLGVSPSRDVPTNFVLLGDAGFSRMDELLAGLDYGFPTARKVGGLNSSGGSSMRRALWQWSAEQGLQANSGGLHTSGCAVLALQGPLAMETLLSGGCRPLSPVGRVYRITKARKNVVLEVVPEDGGPPVTPLALLTELMAELGGDEREQVSKRIMVGLAADCFRDWEDLGPQDFLARGVMGAHAGSGALLVGDSVRPGQRLTFLLRSREGAVHDLLSSCLELKRRELSALLAGPPRPSPLGALIFTCNSRGRGLYKEPHVDSRTLAQHVPVPSAGVFCNGEIGQGEPGAATQLHGFSFAAAIFRPVQQQGRWLELLGREAQQQDGDPKKKGQASQQP